MKTGISMKNCKFYVNEEERVIVCVIHKTEDMLINFINENFCFSDFNIMWGLTTKFFHELDLPNTFIGKAVCAKDDEWNEEKGKLIAYSRAKDKYYKSFFKRANLLINAIDRRLGNMIEVFNNFGMRLEENHTRLQEKIENME